VVTRPEVKMLTFSVFSIISLLLLIVEIKKPRKIKPRIEINRSKLKKTKRIFWLAIGKSVSKKNWKYSRSAHNIKPGTERAVSLTNTLRLNKEIERNASFINPTNVILDCEQ
tara:strand:+ start:234 stop:569 length:336 start_codon:yes stop_codon:yes gene_type:complete